MESSVSSSHSWWWDSHISPKNSKWLQENLTFMDSKVKAMLLVLEEDGDSFVKRAEMYFRKRPQLINLVEEFYRAYRALAERYDNLTGEIRQNIPKSLQSKYGIGDDTIPIQRGMRRKSTTDMASPKPSTPASYNDSVNAPSPLRSARGSASSLLFYNSDYESDAESAIVTDLRQEPKKGFDKERQDSAKPIKSLVSEDRLMLENEELRRKVKDGTEKMKNISALLEALEQDNSSLQQSKREVENELESLGLKVLNLLEEAENLRRGLQEESKEKGRLGAEMQCVQHSLYVLTERYNEDYGQLKEEVLHLQEQKVGLEKQCLSLNRRVSDLERETEDLKIKLQLTKEEQTKLGVELAAVKLALKNLSEKHNADCSQLQEELDCAKVQNSNLMADLSSRLFQLKYLDEKVLSLEKDKVSLIAEVKLWSERSNALEADISLQQQQYEGVRKRFEDGDVESQRLGLELSESHARVEALGKENSFLMTELQALNQRIHGIQNDAEGLRRSLQDSVEEKVKVEAELQAVRHSLYASTEKYETENGQLKKEVAHLQGAILASEEKYDADCGYLKQENADLAAQMSTRVGQLRDMEEKVSALEKEKANLEAEAELLQKRVEEKEAENQRVSLEIEALQKQLHSFRQQTEELNSLCEEYGQEKETAEKTRQELEHRVSVQMGEISRLELTAALEAGKIEKLRLNLGRVQEEKLILCNERDGLADELLTMHALMKDMAEEKASLQRGNEDLESEAGTLKQQIASLQNQVHELLILSADKDEQALKLQRTLGTLQEEYNKESQSSRQRYLQLQEELHSLKAEKEHMFEEKSSLLKERDEAETELASWMQQTAKLQEDLSQLLVAGTRKDEQALKLKEEHARLGIAIQTAQEECSNAVTQLKEAEQKCTHFQQELSMVQLEKELQVRDVSDLNECLRELAQERDSLQKRTEDLESQLSSFREKMEAQMSSLNLEKEQLSDELGNARSLLKALTEEKSSLQKGIEDLGSDLELWKSRTNELQEKLHHQRQEEEELKNGLQASKEHEVKTKLEIQELQLELMTLKENYELKVEKCNRFESECMDLKERALKLEDVQTLEHKSLFQFQDDKVSMMEEEINKLQIDLFNSRTETEHLSHEVKTTAQRFRASEDNCNELQMQIVRLENELSYGESCMEKLRAEIARLQNEKEATGEEVACTNEVLSGNHVVDEASPKEDKVVVKKKQLKKELRSEKEGRLKNESMPAVLHHYQKEESNGRVVYANDGQGHLVNNSQSLIDRGAEHKNKERKKDLVDIRKVGDRRQVKVSCQRLKKALRVQNEEKIDVEQELESRIKQVREMQEEIGRLENEKHELLGKMKIESERFQLVERNVQILQVQNQNYEQEIALLVKKEKRYLTTLRFMRAQVVCLVRKIKDLRAEVENRTKEALNEVEALKEVDVQQSPKLKRIGTQLRVLLEAERMQAEAERAKLGKSSMDTIQEEPKNVSKTVHEEGGGSIGLKRKKKGYRPVCFPRLRYRRKPGLERKE